MQTYSVRGKPLHVRTTRMIVFCLKIQDGLWSNFSPDRDTEIARRNEKRVGYTPIPHSQFGNGFRALQNGPKYQIFLEQVRDRFPTQPEQAFWLRGLFWSIESVDNTTLGVIDELLHRGNTESARIALQLIEGAPPQLALNQPHFAAHVIEECGRVDAKFGELAESVLLVNVQTGAFNRTPGQPSPKYLSIKQRSEVLCGTFAERSPGERLFTRIREVAVENLNRERLDDEQIRLE